MRWCELTVHANADADAGAVDAAAAAVAVVAAAAADEAAPYRLRADPCWHPGCGPNAVAAAVAAYH